MPKLEPECFLSVTIVVSEREIPSSTQSGRIMTMLDPASTAVYLHMINSDLLDALRADDVDGIKFNLAQLRTFSSVALRDYLES